MNTLLCHLTFWQTTHNGKPSASSHSPGPRGSVTSPSVAVAEAVPSRFVPPPRPRSRQFIMTSSIVSLHSSLRDTRTVRRRRIHCRSWRIHFHGCDQSRRTTMRVFGMDCGVRSGWRRELNAGDGLVRVYREMRARMSAGFRVSYIRVPWGAFPVTVYLEVEVPS